MKFLLLTLFINTSCAYFQIIGAEKKEVKKLKGPLNYEFVDTSGTFLKKRHKGFDRNKNLVVKSEISFKGKNSPPVERLISLSRTNNNVNGVELLMPTKSEVIYWFDGKKYLSSIYFDAEKNEVRAISKSEEKEWNKITKRKVHPSRKAYCFFSQVIECVRKSGFFKRARSSRSGSMNLEIVWDGYPFFNEQYLNNKEDLVVPAKFSFASKEAAGIYKYTLDVDGQVVHYLIYRDEHLAKMFWVAQGISQTLME